VKSLVKWPLKFIDYQLFLSKQQTQIQHDPNERAKSFLLNPGQEYSYIFELGDNSSSPLTPSTSTSLLSTNLSSQDLKKLNVPSTLLNGLSPSESLFHLKVLSPILKNNQKAIKKKGSQKSFTCKLLPIASGYLPVPSIELRQKRTQFNEFSPPPSSTSKKFEHLDSSRHLDSSPDSYGDDEQDVLFEKVPSSRILQHFASQQIYIYPPSLHRTSCHAT